MTPYLPQLSASAALGQTTSGTLAATTNSSSYGLNVSQTLFSGMDNYYNYLSAKASYDYYQAAQQKTEADVFNKLRQTFVDLAIAEENITLQKQILERRTNNSDLITLRYDSGKEDKGAMMRTKADQADARFNLDSAQRGKVLAKLKLSQLLSAEVDGADGQLLFSLPALPVFDKLLSAAPAYQMAGKQLENADISYKQTISGFLPSVSLSGSTRMSGTNWPPTGSSNSWSLSVSYPFLPGGSNITSRVQYAAQYDKAKQDFINTQNNLKYAIESAYRDFLDAAEAEEIAKIYVDASAERAEIARVKYLNGLIWYDEWDRIENDYISAQKTWIARRKAAYGGYVQ
ncbi:MAG: TolC family protein [Candidatus Saganbacteria bacterium]|nr:TolC family protein [Candidatus Saganbacteria bacterium]